MGGGAKASEAVGDSVSCSSVTISASRTGGRWFKKYRRNTNGGVFDDAETQIEYWDYAPSPEYFEELFRVSKNQIIWGGNYFSLPPSRCFIVWDKCQPEDFTMAMAEYAWTSFNANGTSKYHRFHPTQKPVSLYRWILQRYAKSGMRILDTHGGSGTIAIAAYEAGVDLDICEICEEYYRKSKEQFARYVQQGDLFVEAIG